jgi:hypothetical protein
MTQIVFLVASCLVAVVAYLLFRAESAEGSLGIWRGVSRFSWLSITVCTICWVALLASPLAKLYP